MGQQPPFWKARPLGQMSEDEWESLCDGCARCCMVKLEDEDSGEIANTRIACRLLDTQTCRCRDYSNRLREVPDCQQIRTLEAAQYHWLPPSCAYRRLAEGRDLASWHPLLSGSASTVVQSGVSMSGRCISEQYVSLEALYDGAAEHFVEFDDP